MIVYQAGLHGAPGHFVIVPGRPGFDAATYATGQTFAEAGTSVRPLLDAKAPSEIDATLAGHGGMHLCHHGPIAAIERMCGGMLLSAQTSTALNTYSHLLGNPARGALGTAALNGHVLASEESAANVVAHTMTAAQNPLRGPIRPPVASMLRGPVPGFGWTPVNRDTILNAFVAWLLLAFFGYLNTPGLGIFGGEL